MFECIDKTELAQKITEVLIQTQFTAWIEPDRDCLTAEDALNIEKRAIACYLGYHKDGKPNVEQILECNKFHRVIDTQTAMIMRRLDV